MNVKVDSYVKLEYLCSEVLIDIQKQSLMKDENKVLLLLLIVCVKVESL
jgi:hypothetical protein